MQILIGYRPWLPSVRAQSVQVVSSAIALARRGHRVRLCYRPTGRHPLEPFGAREVPGLELVKLPSRSAAASWRMRWELLQWPGRFLVREKRLARFLVRWRPDARVVLEAHELDSALLASLGRPADAMLTLEQQVLPHVDAVIANCEGVAEAIETVHGIRSTVIHNAGTVIPSADPGSGFVLPGSLGPGKDVETVARAARERPIDVVGPATPERWRELMALSQGGLRWRGEVDPCGLPALLQRYRAGIVPLGTGLFGRRQTSPLKAFALMGAGVPIIGSDTPALRAAIGTAFEPYTPGDPSSLVKALIRLEDDQTHQARLQAARPRSWDDRAAEVEAVLA